MVCVALYVYVLVRTQDEHTHIHTSKHTHIHTQKHGLISVKDVSGIIRLQYTRSVCVYGSI